MRQVASFGFFLLLAFHAPAAGTNLLTRVDVAANLTAEECPEPRPFDFVGTALEGTSRVTPFCAGSVGIKVEKVIIRTMLLSGAMCGLVGLLLVAGTDHTITTTISGGRGFTAVMISWLSKFNPIIMVLTSFLIAFMEKGAGAISTVFGLNHSFADILTGVILFFIIGSEFFINYNSFKRFHILN